MNGCGACKASEPEWTKFEEEDDDGIKKVKIESSAIPQEWSRDVQAFPTYIVVVDGKKVAKETGADTDLGKLKEVARGAASKNKKNKKD
jgi:thiol-disulfide isomerase/thioredoxin